MADNDLSYENIVEILSEAEQAEKKSERRRKRDLLTVMPAILSAVSFVSLIAVWIILDRAAPPRYYGWLTLFGEYTQEETPWSSVLVNISYIILIVSMTMCVAAFICNRMRMRRQGDKYMISVFLVGAITLVALVAFLVTFLPMNIIGSW